VIIQLPLPNKRLKLAGGDRFNGSGVLCPWRGTDFVQRPCALRASRPQLTRDPLGITRPAVVDWGIGGTNMQLQFTAVFEKVPEGYIGFVEELPGANTQGETLEEARANLGEAVRLVLEANRTLAEESIGGKTVIREPLRLPAA